MMRPELAQFDRNAIPSLKLLRSMPADLHGVIMKLHDALKEMRSCVFRIGLDVMQDSEIAQQVGLSGEALADTLPAIIRKGMMARDDGGALFSPHMYDKLLRSEERAARKAQAEADRAQWVGEAQARGDVPQGMTPKQLASIINGRKGGRPRKNPASAPGQKNMPFYGVVGGTENPNKKPDTAQVIEKQAQSGFSGSAEEEREYINIPLDNSLPPSSSEKPENPKPDDAKVRQVSRAVLDAAGLGADQAVHALREVSAWLDAGGTKEVIVEAVREHRQKMATQKPRHLGAFLKPVERAIKQMKASDQLYKDDSLVQPADEAEKLAQECWAKAEPHFKRLWGEENDFGRLNRLWPEVAERHGLPDCRPSLPAYRAYFEEQLKSSKNEEVMAA